jgi:sulfate adenylyltransferase/3'-phosphoadenosine 5'-phosphosulfate synthase
VTISGELTDLRREAGVPFAGSRHASGLTIWLTGLSGAGKSTIAGRLAAELRAEGRRVEVLDGDAIRENLSKGLGFSKEDRDTNIRRIGYVAQLLTRNGVTVIVAAISPYRAVRDEVRARIGDFIEVHVDCNMDELVRRDVKGLYLRALAGEITHFTGVSDPYEAPAAPEVRVDTRSQTADESVAMILEVVRGGGGLPGARPHGGVLKERLVDQGRAEELDAIAPGLASIELDAWTISDLELLAVGGLSPLEGFMGNEDLLMVRDHMHLASGAVWTLPILLSVTPIQAAALKVGDTIALRSGGATLAVLHVTEVFDYDRHRLALEVYGTDDPAHPGVARTLGQSGWAVAGPVEVLRLPDALFRNYRLTPRETRDLLAQRRWRTMVGFQTRNPVHRAHEYLQKVALESVDGLLLHPLVGETKEDDISAATRMRCYEVLLEKYYPAGRVALAVFPASMRYAGPREAVFHALVRQNYGCTHFIVGRDHAGVGSYYSSYAAQEIFDQFAPGEIGISIMRFEHAFHCRDCGQMVTSRTCPHDSSSHLTLSGTKVRELLREGKALPIEFTRAEVAEVLREPTTV